MFFSLVFACQLHLNPLDTRSSSAGACAVGVASVLVGPPMANRPGSSLENTYLEWQTEPQK